MSMPTYAVCCLSRDRGTTYVIAVQARSIDDARQAAASAGHITGAIHELTDTPAPAAQAGVDDASAERQEQFRRTLALVSANVRDLTIDLASIRRTRLVRAPLSTITGGVLLGALLAAALWMLAQLGWREYQSYLRAASGSQAPLRSPDRDSD